MLAHDALTSSGETISSMAHRSGAIAGINADYFDIGNTNRPTNVVVHDGRAYFVSLGADLIAQFELAGDGTLTPLQPATVPQTPGCGPRHLIFDGR